MSPSADFSRFLSRLHFQAHLAFDTAVRIGASRSTKVDEPDLPIVRDALGRPYIPGSSFKGALRSYVESVLRTLQLDPRLSDRNLACLSVGKPPARPEQDPLSHVCLHQKELEALKEAAASRWTRTNGISAQLMARLPAEQSLNDAADQSSWEAVLDGLLLDLSCWSCRLFGAQWLAARVLVRDLPLSENWAWPSELRNGVAIDRDAGRASPGQLYDLEVLPAGARFDLHLMVENASPAELGLLWLGLAAFQRGEIPLGGARSRGLGWCRLEPRWDCSRYVTADDLLQALFAPQPAAATPGLENQPAVWVRAFGNAIGAATAQGGSNA